MIIFGNLLLIINIDMYLDVNEVKNKITILAIIIMTLLIVFTSNVIIHQNMIPYTRSHLVIMIQLLDIIVTETCTRYIIT